MKEIQALRQAFQSQKMGALLLLGFASGLPLFLTSRTLQLWMQDAKVDIAKITLFGLLSLKSIRFFMSSRVSPADNIFLIYNSIDCLSLPFLYIDLLVLSLK